MKKNDLIYGNIGKAILLFVLPLIAGSLIQQLYVTVDAIIVGRFAGKVGLAAIDSVNTLFKFPINFMNGLASGQSTGKIFTVPFVRRLQLQWCLESLVLLQVPCYLHVF